MIQINYKLFEKYNLKVIKNTKSNYLDTQSLFQVQ